MEIFAAAQIRPGAPQKDNAVTRFLKMRTNDLINVLQKADHANNGGWENGAFFSLVIERDVAPGDRRFKNPTGFTHARDGLLEEIKRFGFIGVAEVQAVGDGDGFCSGAGDVASCLSYGQRRSPTGIQVHEAGIAVSGHGQGHVGVLDPEQGGIRTGA